MNRLLNEKDEMDHELTEGDKVIELVSDAISVVVFSHSCVYRTGNSQSYAYTEVLLDGKSGVKFL